MLTGLVAAAVAMAPVAACAHAVVVTATPAVHARIVPGKLRIRLQLNSRIDPARSRLTLHGPDGSDHPVWVATNESAGVLAGDAEATIPGAWNLRWQVLSIDGHIARGDIPFTVGEGTSGR